MNDVMKEMFLSDGMPEEIAEMMIREVPPEQTLWIISNNRGIDGAVSMLYENELHELAENLESDLYILPSSVHEVLAVSTELTEPEELAQMVAEVNMQKVALEERLSNSFAILIDVKVNNRNLGVWIRRRCIIRQPRW